MQSNNLTKIKPIFRRTSLVLITALAFSLLTLTGCTTTNPYTGEEQASRTTIGTGVGVAGGAILGGLIGGEKGALVGAAAGGLTGAAIGHSIDRENTELRQRLVGTGVQVVKRGNLIHLVMASDVTFKTNSANINASFYQTLNSVAVVLKKYRHNNIIVSGFTDSTGSAAYNQRLSEHRAKSVGAYLNSQGIDARRIFTNGFGKRHPIASNASAHGRSLNRRVVITLRPTR